MGKLRSCRWVEGESQGQMPNRCTRFRRGGILGSKRRWIRPLLAEASVPFEDFPRAEMGAESALIRGESGWSSLRWLSEVTFVFQIGAGPPRSNQSRADASSAFSLPTMVESRCADSVRLSCTSGPKTRFGKAIPRFSHNLAGSLPTRSRSRFRAQMGPACSTRVSWSISSDAGSIVSSGSSSSKWIVTRSLSHSGDEGNPTAIASVMAQKTRASHHWPAASVPRKPETDP